MKKTQLRRWNDPDWNLVLERSFADILFGISIEIKFSVH